MRLLFNILYSCKLRLNISGCMIYHMKIVVVILLRNPSFVESLMSSLPAVN